MDRGLDSYSINECLWNRVEEHVISRNALPVLYFFELQISSFFFQFSQFPS